MSAVPRAWLKNVINSYILSIHLFHYLFFRLCAVFGGTYFLGRSIEGIVVSSGSDDNLGEAKAVITNGQRISCSKLILPRSLCPPDLKAVAASARTILQREIVLTSESILPHDKEQLTFITIPLKTSEVTSTSSPYAYVQEVGFGAAAVPKGMYCLQITSASSECREKSSIPDVRSQIVQDRSHLLWSLKFDMKMDSNEGDLETGINTTNMFLCNGPSFELDYDQNILHAKKLFEVMFPGEEFLPRAPEPEEIILGGDTAEEAHKDEKETQEKVIKDETQKDEKETQEESIKEESKSEEAGDSAVADSEDMDKK